VIAEIRKAFEVEDHSALRSIAVELAKKAAVEQDKASAQLSVIAYSLSKMLTKTHFRRSPHWKEYKAAIVSMLLDAEKGKDGNLIERVEQIIRKIDAEDGHFVKNVVDKARSKMAAIAYSVGISVSLAAKLFGSDMHDLYDYLGKMRVHDEEQTRTGIKERVSALRRLLNAGSR